MGFELTESGTDNHVRGGTDIEGATLPIEIRGSGNSVKIGPRLQIHNGFRIHIEGNGNEIVFGAGDTLDGFSLIRVLGSNNRVAIGNWCSGNLRINTRTDNSVFEMGDRCTAVGAQFGLDEPERIVLGRDCMLSAGVWLTVSDMHSIVDLDSGERTNPAGSVHLGDHVWLGARVMVLKGVKIGTGSIIGAGAVVTHSVPENCMATGVPAQIIRRNVSWHRRLTTLAARASVEIEVHHRSRS